jgi:hypothetical protein
MSPLLVPASGFHRFSTISLRTTSLTCPASSRHTAGSQSRQASQPPRSCVGAPIVALISQLSNRGSCRCLVSGKGGDKGKGKFGKLNSEEGHGDEAITGRRSALISR